MDAPDDAWLLQRWRAGDRGAGQALMRRHYAGVLRYFELNASWAAEDLVQATFMACVERAGDVRDAAAFRGYLMGIARRQLALHLRELSRKGYGEFDEEQAPQRTQLSTLIARSRDQTLVLRALASLPRRPQLLLVLFYWDRMTTPQLASALAIPESTVRTQLARARDRLRRRMEELAGTGMVRLDDHEQWLPQLLVSVTSSAGELPTFGR
ncbi:RNA polymerase sigma factor [Paraliomyxa miuraensis]|uniref:RNA polymerase sigma factor n=1 Tax=Paraliomyxa miuraensis TaxID=376150 RepID=UPI00225B396D|nr:sigma-70 family RNA polymerase sigma factor [Paraliomyxa miuraensis]MCX4243350.1 sigma-70 family RNA polymerase sigma factor [Paraliomyxa miuraensis]